MLNYHLTLIVTYHVCANIAILHQIRTLNAVYMMLVLDFKVDYKLKDPQRYFRGMHGMSY